MLGYKYLESDMPLNRSVPKPSLTSPSGAGSIAPGQGLRLSRSPHPYHKNFSRGQQCELADPKSSSSTTAADPRATRSTAGSRENEHDGGTYFDTDRKRRRSLSSLSESGTEADDESGGMLRGLPAPPLRLRKGLKKSQTIGTTSPLITPTYLDENDRNDFLAHPTKRLRKLQCPPPTDAEMLRIREKYTRRRRAELLRRVTETVLLGSVGCITWAKGPESLFGVWKRGNCLVREWKYKQAERPSRASRPWLSPDWDIPAIPFTYHIRATWRNFSEKNISLALEDTCGL